MKRMFLPALSLCLLTCMANPPNHPRPVPGGWPAMFVPKVSAGSVYGAAAKTFCDTVANRPYIVIDTSYVGKKQWKFLLAHELQHVRQQMNYPGGCVVSGRRYSIDPQFRLDMELDAQCAELKAEVADGVLTYDQDVERIVRYYHGNGSFPVKLAYDFDLLEAHFRSICPDPAAVKVAGGT